VNSQRERRKGASAEEKINKKESLRGEKVENADLRIDGGKGMDN